MTFQACRKMKFLHSMTLQIFLTCTFYYTIYGRGGHQALMFMRLFKAYVRSTLSDIDRFTRYS